MIFDICDVQNHDYWHFAECSKLNLLLFKAISIHEVHHQKEIYSQKSVTQSQLRKLTLWTSLSNSHLSPEGSLFGQCDEGKIGKDESIGQDESHQKWHAQSIWKTLPYQLSIIVQLSRELGK